MNAPADAFSNAQVTRAGVHEVLMAVGLVCRVVMCIQGVRVPYGPLMTGTIRLSKGVRREAESEESR